MSLTETSGLTAFRYEAVGRDGRAVSELTHAVDENAALRRLAADGLMVTRIAPAVVAAPSGGRSMRFGDRVLVLRQLALMLKAGVPLLEALESVRDGMPGDGRRQFAELVGALRQGSSFGDALRAHTTGFPAYVHALAGVGEASGRIGEVMAGAAEQMDYERRLQREFVNALTYPAFLVCAGVAAIGFILVEIVPRFSAMIGDNIDRAPFASRLLLRLGNFVSTHSWLSGGLVAAVVLAVAFVAATPSARAGAYGAARNAPILGRLLKAREITLWARLTAFALSHGVDLLPAVALARQATPDGPLQRGLVAFEADLRAGRGVEEALAKNTPLGAMDLSLLRAGQRSGALPAMFSALAGKYDDELKDGMKRLTAVLEPVAIGVIASVIGGVALSLVMALASIYDTVY